MQNTQVNKLLKKALFLETKQRTEFLNQIEEGELKEKLTLLLNDDTALTNFVLKTSQGAKPLTQHQIKDLKPGDKVNQFIVVKLIAKGGMGSVYLAYDEKLKRNVAIKTIRSEYIKNQATQQRFKQEAQILSQINHPSICQIYEYIDYDDGDLLVLELVNGITLNNANLDDQKKLDVFIQLASALEVAHNKGVIHRDLKPDNIMCSDENKIKILDFGIAKSKAIGESDPNVNEIEINTPEKPLTKMGTLMGTLLYMSPEQAEGKEVTTFSDIYSFGIIMQEILTGVTVYDLANTEDLKQQVINAEKINNELIPKEYTKLIEAMTQREPQKRPIAKKLSQDLLEIKQAPIKKLKQRRKILISVTVFILLISLIYQWYSFTRDREKITFHNKLINQISEIESTWQNIYTLPLHNISKDLESFFQYKDKLIHKIDAMKVINKKEKNLLKGQLYFAYKDYENALRFLEKTTLEEMKNDGLATKLAMSHMMVYYKITKDLRYKTGFEDKEIFEKLNNKYVIPTQKLLKNIKSKTTNSLFTKALLFWQKKEFNEAINILDKMIKQKNWYFEAFQLKGEILQSQGILLQNQGKYRKSNKLFDQAKQVYKDASSRGRSFTEAYAKVCLINIYKIFNASNLTGENTSSFYQEASEYCENALKINPKSTYINVLLARLNKDYGYSLYKKGKNPLNYFKKSIQFARVKPINKNQYIIIAQVLTYSAMFKNDNGKNPLVDYDNAINTYSKAQALQKVILDSDYANIMYLYVMKLDYEYTKGINPAKTLAKILEYNELVKHAQHALNDTDSFRHTMLANTYIYVLHYQYLVGQDMTSSVSKVEEHIKEALKFSSQNPYLYSILAEAYAAHIKEQIEHSIIEKQQLNKALDAVNKALELMPSNSDFMTLKARILTLKSLFNKQKNPNHVPDFKPAIEMYKKSLEINANYVYTHMEFAKLYLLVAKNTKNLKEKESYIKKGLSYSDKSLAINDNYSFSYYIKAQLLSYGLQQGLFASNVETNINENYRKAHAINPLLKKP